MRREKEEGGKMSHWEHENGFYQTAPFDRLAKALAQYEIMKVAMGVAGDIVEVGVHKGCSLIRLLTYRDLLGGALARRVYGFDMFGAFP
ncbi:MAG: hypothetical protein NUV84_03000, partial [Candidatus Uhrbacteria bacterium]|nr:hypothetical protein [Candidatus Uhrbacteria bacterium]